MSAIRSFARTAVGSTRSTPRHIAPLSSSRPFYTINALRLPYKDSQDRESLKPGSTENTKTGRDEDIARESPDAAFNPDKTSPEAEGQADPQTLDASGANPGLSRPQGDEKDIRKQGAGKETRKGGASGGGSGPKAGDPKKV